LKNKVWIVIHEIKNVPSPTGSHNSWYLQGLKPHPLRRTSDIGKRCV